MIDGLKVSYFNKLYPTDYEVQVSNDNKNWTTVKTLSKEHNGEVNPTDEIQFETPVSARYVKMLFKELNSAAVVMALESMRQKLLADMYMKMRSVQSVSANTDILVQKDSQFDTAKLPAVNGIWVTVEEMTDTIKVLVPVTWNADNVDTGTVDTYMLKEH